MRTREWKGNCHRCGKKSGGYTMSWLSTQLICFDCDREEQDHPRLDEAKEAEAKEVAAGNMNYPGLLDKRG